jgi:hypothetical protein
MSENNILKAPYIKPQVMVLGVKLSCLICTSSPLLYYIGGGGTYDEDSIWGNGEDY